MEVRGLDVINPEDVGVYEYVDSVVSEVNRITRLSDADMILSKDQTEVMSLPLLPAQTTWRPGWLSCVVRSA